MKNSLTNLLDTTCELSISSFLPFICTCLNNSWMLCYTHSFSLFLFVPLIDPCHQYYRHLNIDFILFLLFLHFLLHLVDDLRNTITTNNLHLLPPVLCADDEKFSSSFCYSFFSSVVFACSILGLLLAAQFDGMLYFVVQNWHANFSEVFGSGLRDVLLDLLKTSIW
jgi:hypothetical protein